MLKGLDVIFFLLFLSKIFRADTTQQQFYDGTMRKMVKDVLQGENRLLYTYGVTNSGKTYTVQGESVCLVLPGHTLQNDRLQPGKL